MHHYLAPYIGSGILLDPFRPRGSEQPGWSAIDLRPDCTVLTGRAVLAVPVRDDTIGTYLGQDLRVKSAAIKTAVESRFALTLEADTIRDILVELLIAHARTDGTRWKPLRAGHDRLLKIFLGPGPPIWQQPVIAGGVQIADTFDRANADALGTSSDAQFSWTETQGDIDIVINAAITQTVAAVDHARAEIDLATVNHFAQADVYTNLESAVVVGLVTTRYAAGANTEYQFGPRFDTDKGQIYKNIATTTTLLQESAVTVAAGVAYTTKGISNGSTQQLWISGSQVGGDLTDTAIDGVTVGGKRTGLYSYNANGGGYVRFDNFSAGDLVEGHPAIKRFGGVPFAALNRGVW